MRRAAAVVLLLAAACKKKAPDLDARFESAVLLAAGEWQEDLKTPYIKGKVVPVWVQRNRVAGEVYELLPPELRAESDRDMGTIAKLDCRSMAVGSYSNGMPAYRHYCSVLVFDLAAQAVVARRGFAGPLPSSELADDTGNTAPPAFADIAEWLKRLPRR